MNLFRAEVGGGLQVNIEAVQGIAIRQRPDSRLGTAFRRIAGGKVFFKGPIGWANLLINDAKDLLMEAFLWCVPP